MSSHKLKNNFAVRKGMKLISSLFSLMAATHMFTEHVRSVCRTTTVGIFHVRIRNLSRRVLIFFYGKLISIQYFLKTV